MYNLAKHKCIKFCKTNGWIREQWLSYLENTGIKNNIKDFFVFSYTFNSFYQGNQHVTSGEEVLIKPSNSDGKIFYYKCAIHLNNTSGLPKKLISKQSKGNEIFTNING